jgi:hypothetical protein
MPVIIRQTIYLIFFVAHFERSFFVLLGLGKAAAAEFNRSFESTNTPTRGLQQFCRPNKHREDAGSVFL